MAAIQNESKRSPLGPFYLGKYKVTREIGRGGMAAVYPEAVHISLNKRIAIKILAAELAASTVVIERFFREARAAASVKRNPHIVEVYDSGGASTTGGRSSRWSCSKGSRSTTEWRAFGSSTSRRPSA